ncbi:hypothetical protein GCM10028807_00150 [Spirosoma daeguense]
MQGAINASASGDQVWVAAGTYKPGGNANTDRGISFTLKNDVAIYGNFMGTETALSGRTLTNPLNTILSGDIGTVGDNSDNSNRIIVNDGNNLTTSAILDGFMISDANGGVFGAGMYNKNSSPTIRNCLFQNNVASAWGGAMTNWADGGGNAASPVLINCSFLNNSAQIGGAIYIYGINSGSSSPQLTNCSFQGNTATTGASAIGVTTNQGIASPQATNCIILGSISMSFSGAQPTFATTNCLIQPGAVSGGAAGNFSQTNNISSSVSPFVSTNTTQINDCSQVINAGLNTAPGLSGITTDMGGNPRVFPVSGGTVDIGAYEYAAVANPRAPAEITVQPTSVSYACAGTTVTARVQARGTSLSYQWYKTGPGGVGSATAVSGATSATLTLNNIQLSDAGSYSVAITGCTSVTSTAFALVVNPPLFVTPSGAGLQNGTNWANAYPGSQLQTAINAAASSCGKQVWVASGTYKPTTTNDRSIAFTMQPGVAIYGGFVGNETTLSQRPAISTSVPPSTTLSADIANNINVSSYNLFRNGNNLTSTAVLDGFVLAYALANNTGSQQGTALGGAMYNQASGGTCNPTIRNCWFMNNISLGGGGAIMNYASSGGDTSPTIENCRFQNNSVQQGSGGAIHNRAQSASNSLNYATKSSPKILNCLFINNSCSGGNASYDGGGAIHNYAYGGTASPTITGSAFQNNSASIQGGAICTNGSDDGAGSFIGTAKPVFTNCSFQGNSAPQGQGPVIANIHYNNNGLSTNANATLLNCIVFNNGTVPFVNASGAMVSFSYSLYETAVDGQNGVNTTGAGNIATNVSPFANTTSTVLSTCSQAINVGQNSAANLTGVTTDVAGNVRISGGTVDMGAYESTLTLNAGTIAGPPIIPYPQESPNSFTNVTAATGAVGETVQLRWQLSDDNGANWADLASSNVQSIPFPAGLTTDGNPNKTYQFRRLVTNTCSFSAISNVASVKMIRSNGVFNGQVVSSDGVTPVASVTITVVRNTTGLAGSPGSWTYTGVTATDGTYTIGQVYYGVPAGTVPTSLTAATFTVTPRYTDPASLTLVHTFTPTSSTYTMNETNTPKSFNFTDNTTFGISGQTRQTCPDCITGFSGQTPITGNVTCPVDGVSIRTYRNGTQINLTTSNFIGTPTPGDYGRYAVAVNNPGSYSLTSSMANLVFVPGGQMVNVVSDVYNVNFDSPTSQTITGRVAAGCNEAIGSAVLEFTDILKDGSNNPRPSCFRKQVTTSPTGFYSIALPPRKYKVTVISFTPSGSVSSPDFLDFINNQYPADSLIRDLTSTTAVTTLNLTYQRAPTLNVAGLVSPPNCGTSAGYSLMQQANPTSLTVTAYQGPVALGCPVISGTVLVSTNTQVSSGENFTSVVNATSAGSQSLTIVPGTPNVAAPYYRFLNVQFSDPFGRSATPLNRNVVVTGVQAGTATFTTVSPQIPFLVLHDPPGDQSYSYWSQNTKLENAMRFSYDLGLAQKSWFEAKVGVKFAAGLFVSTETSIFGTIGGNITTSGRVANASETILTNTTNQYIATKADKSVVGPDADVFIGAALNLYYAVSTVISYDPASCSVSSAQRLMVANKGVSTQFYYSAYEIKNSVIPELAFLRDASPADSTKRRYQNQINVWQQTLDNNTRNRQVAPFVTNKTFDGVVGAVDESITKSVSKSNTIEFGLTLETEFATSLGFEIAGNGVSGGTSINFKTEIGSSSTNTNTVETTTGFHLADSNPGDRISVDIKTDPVYSTPVFELLGGKSSCPPEEGALARDRFELTAPVTVVRDVAPGGQAQFTLNMSNVSQVVTDGSRKVYLKLVDGTNIDGANIEVDGSPYTGTPRGPFTVNRLSQLSVIVRVGKSAASNVYAYEGLQFQVVDDCGGTPGSGDALGTVTLSAYFQSSCSSVSLTTPGSNWVSTLADNNQLPVLIGGYTLANLSNVTLQYRLQGGSSWLDALTLNQGQLSNSPNGTQTNWNTSGLTDGAYTIRLKLNCPLAGGATGTVYSQQVNGLIDRTRPVPFGNTLPTSDTYVTGSTIGITYNEALNCSSITAGNLVAKRVSNGQVVPMSVGCYQNQVVAVPLSSLTSFTGDIISLMLTGVSDLYGNPRLTTDSWSFRVGSTTAATGNDALSMAITGSPISESSTGSMIVTFNLPAPVSSTMVNSGILVTFNVAGTAQFGVDYTVSYANPSAQPVSATVNGTTGKILIPSGSSSATLLIKPINETLFEPDETIILSLLSGGDYQIGATSSVTAVILNDDATCLDANGAVTTLKTGNWSDVTVWSCGVVPNSTTIVKLNHAVTLTTNYVAEVKTLRYGAGGKITYQTGAKVKLGF